MKYFFFSLLCTVSFLQAQETGKIKTPEQIQAELDQAQRDFETAKEMFIPWYTGPLITGSANNVPKGKTNIQGYVFLQDRYAVFNANRKSVNAPDIWTINPLGLFQRGLLDWLDITVISQGFFRFSQCKYGQGFGDITSFFGIQLVKQTPDLPSIRFTAGEVFPTGKYQKLNPDRIGLDASGGGAYRTQFGLFINKIFWKIKLHPISFRLATTYTFANHRVFVKGFNAYGGGFGTRGNVCVGDAINVDTAAEVSITQKWVFAVDLVYSYSFKSTFSGTLGEIEPGVPAAVGGPSSDNLSLAPAIEYNVSSTGGFIGGIWFSLTGRNSGNFVSLVLSYTQLF